MFRWKLFILWSLASIPSYILLYFLCRLIGFSEDRSSRYALYGAVGGIGGAVTIAKMNPEEDPEEDPDEEPGAKAARAPWPKVAACSGLVGLMAAVAVGCIGFYRVRGRGGFEYEAMHTAINAGITSFVIASAGASTYFAKRFKPSQSDSDAAQDGSTGANAARGNGLRIFAGASALAAMVGVVLGFLTAIISMRFGVTTQDAIDRGVVVGAIGLVTSFCVSALLFMMYLSADRSVSDATERPSLKDE